MSVILDGKAVSAAVKEKVKAECDDLKARGVVPSLAVIIVGEDPASRVYVNNKKKACAFCGFDSREFALPVETTQSELIGLIEELNGDNSVHGILCQLPLPPHISEQAVIESIDPDKDVDCFSNINVGKLWTDNYLFKPCTPAGVMEILSHYDIPVDGKNAVIIGRSNIVGKPMAALLLSNNATVTVCHSHTVDLIKHTSEADIIIAAIGKPNFVTENMVREGAVVIDVGINRLPDGRLCGDVDFEAVSQKTYAITPVPGGCGPMTIAVLMQNTLAAAKRAAGVAFH